MPAPIKPRRLEPGGTVALVAPASAPPDPKTIDRSVAVLEKLGFKVQLGVNVRKRFGFLAGNDRERAGDLMRAFNDRKINAIFCVRGGYGTARLLPLLDFREIRRHRKIFVGYSDITSLHCALLMRAGLVSFHGPMLNTDLAETRRTDFTLQSLLRTLMEPVAPGGICRGYNGRTVSILRRGVASGRLIGGNLSVLCTTVGTPIQPPFRNAILFLEDVDEAPYRFDRMLTYLLNAGLLQQVAGIAIGINKDCVDPMAGKSNERRQTLEDVLKERLLPLKIPIVTGLPFGHIPFNATLPIGVSATLDGKKGDLIFEAPAVK